MTVFVLKIIAYISMIIDHLTMVFLPAALENGTMNPLYLIGRSLGRPAFIIFSFLVVEGYFHTRDRMKYARNLLILAVLSELPFDLVLNGVATSEYMEYQNVIWTLLLGYLSVWIIDNIKLKYFIEYRIRYYIYTVGVITVAFAAGYICRIDYGGMGIMCILLFFYFWRNERQLIIGLTVWGIACFFLDSPLELIGVFIDLLLLHNYKGEKGPSAKLLFYTIYPLHLLILGLIANFNAIIAMF